MSCDRTTALTDLERDLPTSREDVEVLRRLRRQVVAHPIEAVQALVDSLPASARRQRRGTSEGWAEFTL